MVKCKPQHIHVPHDSRPEGKRTKYSNTICYCKLQPSRTLTPPKVLEICTMEQLEKELLRNWIPERKQQEKFSEFFENPLMKKDDDFLKSPSEAPVHRKVLLEDRNISPKTQEAFDKLCKKYDDIISKNSGDIGKTMLVEMEIDTGNHPPIASKTIHPTLKTLRLGTKRNKNSRKSRNNRKKHLTMGITGSDSSKEKRTRQTSQKENVRGLPKNQQATTQSYQGGQRKRMHFTHTTPKNRQTLRKTQRLQSFLKS